MDNTIQNAMYARGSSVDDSWRNRFARFFRDESAQAATEYILIIGLIVIPLAVAFNKLSGVLKDVLNRIAKLLYGPGV